jgi:superfamily II DNA or RNA helicase
VQIVCNVRIASYGFDLPILSCLIDAAPTDSIPNHVQKFGRVLRPDPAPVGPREYQNIIMDRLAVALEAGRNPIVVAPTGSGKSWTVAQVARRAIENGFRVGYLVDRRALIHDLANRIAAAGLRYGVVMAGHKRYDPSAPVQIGSIDTLHRRQHAMDVDCIIIDEARKSLSPKWEEVLNAHPGVRLIGLDATPIPGLTKWFDEMVEGPNVGELKRQGFLVPYTVLVPDQPNTAGTDFQPGKLAAVMSERAIVGNVVRTWLEKGSDRRTILFAPNRECSEAYAAEFRAAGVQAIHVDQDTPDEERERVWAAMRKGAAPKKDALILDHAGNCTRLNLTPSDILGWNLEDGTPKRISDDNPALGIRYCGQCLCAFYSRLGKCPECGFVVSKTVAQIKKAEGELVEFKRKQREDGIQRLAADEVLKLKYFRWLDLAAAKKWKPNAAKMRFNLETGKWPVKAWGDEWERQQQAAQ